MSQEIQRYQASWTLQQFLAENIAEELNICQTMLSRGILPGDESLFPEHVDRESFLRGKIAALEELQHVMGWYRERKQAEAAASDGEGDEVWEQELH